MKKLRVWDRGKESSSNDWSRISWKSKTLMYPLSDPSPHPVLSTADYTVQNNDPFPWHPLLHIANFIYWEEVWKKNWCVVD
jgi:hypothetical protein